jgi:hypothetical protein
MAIIQPDRKPINQLARQHDRIVERTRDPGEPSQDPQAQPPDAKPSVDDQERS